MAFLNHGPPKSERPDKTPYTVYYPHSTPHTSRKWNQGYLQIVSIDPARKNYAMRIERRYDNGWITPVMFDKVAIQQTHEVNDTTISQTYDNLTKFFNKYKALFNECHIIIFERQLPQNYQAVRIAQHTLSYFLITLCDMPLLPSIIEVDAKLKGRILGFQKGMDLKQWAVNTAREILELRKDDFSLRVMDGFRSKQDDLADTVCQIEALLISWGFPPTAAAPTTTTNNILSNVQNISTVLTPVMIVKKYSKPAVVPAPAGKMLSLVQQAPVRTLVVNKPSLTLVVAQPRTS